MNATQSTPQKQQTLLLKHTWMGQQQQLVLVFDPVTQTLEVIVDDDARSSWASIMLTSHETAALFTTTANWQAGREPSS